jgi:hypothetical protein
MAGLMISSASTIFDSHRAPLYQRAFRKSYVVLRTTQHARRKAEALPSDGALAQDEESIGRYGLRFGPYGGDLLGLIARDDVGMTAYMVRVDALSAAGLIFVAVAGGSLLKRKK